MTPAAWPPAQRRGRAALSRRRGPYPERNSVLSSEAAEFREVLLRVDEPRLESQRLLKLIGRFLELPLRGKRNSQVVVGFGGMRHELESHGELIARVPEHACLQQHTAQIVAGRAVTGIELHRAAQMLN